MNYYVDNKKTIRAKIALITERLVAAKQIAGVDLVCHILKLFCHSVGNNDVGLLFEGGEITPVRELKNKSSFITGS